MLMMAMAAVVVVGGHAVALRVAVVVGVMPMVHRRTFIGLPIPGFVSILPIRRFVLISQEVFGFPIATGACSHLGGVRGLGIWLNGGGELKMSNCL